LDQHGVNTHKIVAPLLDPYQGKTLPALYRL
jgi:hypothetical protein